MAMIAGACMDIYHAYFAIGRRTTRGFSHQLLCGICSIVVMVGSRHVLGAGEMSTEALESRTHFSARYLREVLCSCVTASLYPMCVWAEWTAGG